MSYAAEGWAWKQRCPSSAAKLVLVCLGWFANEIGASAFPSIPTILARTQLADKTARKALAELIEAKLIKPNPRMKGNLCLSTEYCLNIGDTPPVNPVPPRKSRGVRATPSKSTTTPLVNLPSPPGKSTRESITERKEEERKEESPLPPRGGKERWIPRKSPRAKACREDPAFAVFYEAYPKHDAPDDALKAWRQVLSRGVTPAEIMAGLARYQFSPDQQFIRLPAGWLRGGCWKAEADTFDPVLRAVGLGPEDYSVGPDFSNAQGSLQGLLQ